MFELKKELGENFNFFNNSVMSFKRAKIIMCRSKKNHRVWIQFADGLSGEVDLSHLVGKGAFRQAWSTVEKFNQVYVDPESHTLAWKVGSDQIDLDPFVLRKEVAENYSKGQ
ncbi:MAG: hypothetical protein ChlgKO_05110 [Chlamydiales bacterium]